jgi:ketosteroid isomerase-like protein
MPTPPPPPIQTLTRTFLDAYAAADSATLLPLIDADHIAVYGSDAAEFVEGRAAFSAMLEHSARIGTMQHVSIVVSGDLATIFFDASFTVGDRPPIPIRCALVWQRHADRWLLRQAANVVPTTGQSAAKLLAGRPQ